MIKKIKYKFDKFFIITKIFINTRNTKCPLTDCYYSDLQQKNKLGKQVSLLIHNHSEKQLLYQKHCIGLEMFKHSMTWREVCQISIIKNRILNLLI